MWFVDGWDIFNGRRGMFAVDGVHLSRNGVDRFSDLLEGVAKDIWQGN